MLTLLATLLVAQASELDGALDRLAAVKPGDGAAYVEARDRVLAFGKDALPALEARGAPDRWTDAGWVRAAAAESCRLRLSRPDLAAAVDRPEGIDPARYRLFRHGRPLVLPQLSRLGADSVPLLVERWRWTFDQLTFSEGAAGELEREVLRTAILILPGRIGDQRAKPFLAEVLDSTAVRDAWRAEAAVSLGIVGGRGSLARLTRHLDDATQSATIREAAARALGRVPEVEALEEIRSRIDGEKDAQVRRSLLHALGYLGSAGAWTSRGKDAAGTAAVVRSGCAGTLVAAIRKYPSEAETLGIALAMTAWESSLQAVETLASDSSPDVAEAAKRILPGLKLAVERRK